MVSLRYLVFGYLGPQDFLGCPRARNTPFSFGHGIPRMWVSERVRLASKESTQHNNYDSEYRNPKHPIREHFEPLRAEFRPFGSSGLGEEPPRPPSSRTASKQPPEKQM